MGRDGGGGAGWCWWGGGGGRVRRGPGRGGLAGWGVPGLHKASHRSNAGETPLSLQQQPSSEQPPGGASIAEYEWFLTCHLEHPSASMNLTLAISTGPLLSYHCGSTKSVPKKVRTFPHTQKLLRFPRLRRNLLVSES